MKSTFETSGQGPVVSGQARPSATRHWALVLLLAASASGLWANDIAVSAPDGKSGWLLLENPPGVAGPGLSDFAGDPGMPAPDAHRWPHALKADGAPLTDGGYPQTELWYFADGKYTRATHFLDGSTAPHKRTLIAVVTIGGKPFVLHLDKFKTQLVRVDEASAKAGGSVPADAIVLNPDAFLDAPAVSPDSKLIAFRAWTKAQPSLRVYSTETWKLLAESEPRTFARPVWIDNTALAVIAWAAAALPEAPQSNLSESHTPQPGKLLRADLAEAKLNLTELLSGSFPPDRYTRTVEADPAGLGLVVAVADGAGVLAEQLEPKAGGKTREIARFDFWRGWCIAPTLVRCAGIRLDEKSTRTFVFASVGRSDGPPKESTRSYVSTVGHGGLVDLGSGVAGLLEAVANPAYESGSGPDAQMLRHTLLVFEWPGCDTMRNPRVLQRLSKFVNRFGELGNVQSTLLVFDVIITANDGANKKSGRYVELYSAKGRKDHGAIRIEDSLSGSWLVQSIEGGGSEATDDYYSWAGTAPANAPKMDSKPAANAGKAYGDLITQLEARRLLMLNSVEADWAHGGLTFLGRDAYRNPGSGVTWRTWVYEKYGRVLDEEKYKQEEANLKTLQEAAAKAGDAERPAAELAVRAKIRDLKELRERVEVRFVADLPVGSAGSWSFPHAIAQVKMRFALSNGQKAAVTELSFEPDSCVALPDLLEQGESGKTGKELLLPKTFRIYGRDKDGKQIEQLKATAIVGERPDRAKPAAPLSHPEQLVKGGKLTPGYNVPGATLGPGQFTDLKR